MQNMVMRQSVVVPTWGMRETARTTVHGSVYFAFALIVLAVALTAAAAVFPDFFAGNVSHFGPGTP